MYGIVNKALHDLIVGEYGEAVWQEIKSRAEVDVEVFIGTQGYPDSVTYSLVGAASEVLGRSAEELLETFGKHWVLKTAPEVYPDLIQSGGKTLREFLVNLPNFHARVALILPHLEPPEFACTDVAKDSLTLHYYSKREGLAPLVKGMIVALGDMYGSPVSIVHSQSRGSGADHDAFRVSWDQRS